MVEVKAALVKELRDETNLGMMACKKALVEAEGDKDRAITLLRERGLAKAVDKSDRAANEGAIAADISADGQSGVIIEVNCETDFAAKNETFQAFVKDLLPRAAELEDGQLADATKDQVAAKVAEIGENIVVRRNHRFVLQGSGLIATYIHLGGKVGVLLEVGCDKAESAESDDFKALAKDITLHIAASNPEFLQREDVPEDVVAEERRIFAKQVENKPAEIIDKIVTGKIDKYYGERCLVEQGFVKDPDITVSERVQSTAKGLGDNLSIRRFLRYQIGA